jgi:anti-sigma-K factor RskA
VTKCRMCSQIIYGRRKLCPDCEWEIEAAQAVADAAADPDAQAGAGVDAAPQSMPSADISQADASVSFNLWRTRRGSRSTALAVVAALALAGIVSLRPGSAPARASVSVMDGADAVASASRGDDARVRAVPRNPTQVAVRR